MRQIKKMSYSEMDQNVYEELVRQTSENDGVDLMDLLLMYNENLDVENNNTNYNNTNYNNTNYNNINIIHYNDNNNVNTYMHMNQNTTINNN